MNILDWALLSTLTFTGCNSPPPNWAQGGAPLDIPRARWTRLHTQIDIMPDGNVLADGEHVLFKIDRAGRLRSPNDTPIAVLESDGRLMGPGDELLGRIELRSAVPADRDLAWLSIGEHGEVRLVGSDGKIEVAGGWTGCETAVRTCTLATHFVEIIESRIEDRRRRSRMNTRLMSPPLKN
jgi:hypothetical protein